MTFINFTNSWSYLVILNRTRTLFPALAPTSWSVTLLLNKTSPHFPPICKVISLVPFIHCNSYTKPGMCFGFDRIFVKKVLKYKVFITMFWHNIHPNNFDLYVSYLTGPDSSLYCIRIRTRQGMYGQI